MVPGVAYCLPPPAPQDIQLLVLQASATSPSTLRVVYVDPARPSLAPILSLRVWVDTIQPDPPAILSTVVTIPAGNLVNASAAERATLANAVSMCVYVGSG